MLTALTVFAIGVGMLVAAAEVLIKAAVGLSYRTKISPLVIGTTVIAIGTSLPELVVAIVSGIRQDEGLGLGNIIGANIVNVFLVLALAIVVGKIRIGTSKTPRNAWFLAGATLIFMVFYAGFNPMLAGFALIGSAGLFTWMEYRWGRRGRDHEDLVRLRHLKKKDGIVSMPILWLALAGVIGGGLMTVIYAEKIAVISGYSTTVIGMSLLALSTTLPELAVTVLSARQKQDKLAVGNILGSNIFNLLLIGGVLAFFAPSRMIAAGQLTYLAFSAVGLAGLVFGFKGRIIPRWIGVLMLAIFGVYLKSLI